MKTKLLTAAFLLLTILACNKDKFQTTPTLEVKNLNTKEVVPNSNLEIKMEYTDKEGDLGDGTLTYIRIRTNFFPIPNPSLYDKVDTIKSAVPGFPVNSKGEILLTIPYNFMDEDPNRNDTMFFKITVKDIRNNSSDTISTATVVAKQN
ncbi:MAG: hypothetical protein EPN92_05430 [Chitinophagaceae bacterium]|nr:MAG: hypothetical protein EPN92_05430 [Chitinophagaceae bacterium]